MLALMTGTMRMMPQTESELRRVDAEIQHLSVMVEALVKTLATQVNAVTHFSFPHICGTPDHQMM